MSALAHDRRSRSACRSRSPAAAVLLPGFTNHDLSLFKDFPLRGSHKLQFRWEIYNLFNHPQWNEVDTSAQFDAAGNQTDVNFGKVTSARTERRMQLSFRYQLQGDRHLFSRFVKRCLSPLSGWAAPQGRRRSGLGTGAYCSRSIRGPALGMPPTAA